MSEVKTQTVYIEVPVSSDKIMGVVQPYTGGIFFVEKKEDQIVMSKEEFEKYTEDIKFEAHNQGFKAGHDYGKIPF